MLAVGAGPPAPVAQPQVPRGRDVTGSEQPDLFASDRLTDDEVAQVQQADRLRLMARTAPSLADDLRSEDGERRARALQRLEESGDRPTPEQLQELQRFLHHDGTGWQRPERELRSEERARAALLLGDAGREAGGEELEGIRKALRQGLSYFSGIEPDVPNPAAQAMQRISDRLDAEDARALTEHLSYDSATTLGRFVRRLSADERREVIEDVSYQLASPQHQPAARVLDHLARELTKGDVSRLNGTTQFGDAHRDALLRVVKENPGKAEQLAAARGVRGYPKHRDQLVEAATRSRHPEVRREVESYLPRSPVKDDLHERLLGTMQRFLADDISRAPEGSDLHRLGQMVQMRELARDPKFEYRDQIDPDKVDREISRLMETPGIRRRLEEVSDLSLMNVLGPPAERHASAVRQNEYMNSKAFGQRLSLLPQDEAKALMSREMAKLRTLDPEVARETAESLRQSLEVDERRAVDPLGRGGPGVLPLVGETNQLRRVLLTDLSKEAAYMRTLGKVASVAGVVLNGVAAADEFDNDDVGGGIGKGLEGVGSGLLIINPVAGIIVGGLGILIDAIFGEDPQETMIRNLGVARD